MRWWVGTDLIFRKLFRCDARNHRRRAARLRRHCPCWCYEANSDTLLTGGRLDSLKSGEPVAGSARGVPGLWSAAVQCGFSSLADFSRKVSRCQLHPSLQQKFLTRGQRRERGEGACGAGCCCQLAAARRRGLPAFSPKYESPAGAPPVQDCPPRSGPGVSLRREAGGCRSGRL